MKGEMTGATLTLLNRGFRVTPQKLRSSVRIWFEPTWKHCPVSFFSFLSGTQHQHETQVPRR